MNIVTLIHNFRDAIHDDSALQTWCTTNYGSAHRVHVGIDTRKPPAIDRPLIHVFPLSRTDGSQGETCVIGVSCGIPDDDLLTTTKARVIELEGISKLDDFRDAVKTIIEGVSLSSGQWLGDIETNYEAVEYFPFFLAAMEVPVHYKTRRLRSAL
jgi:hypothetical protein